MDVVIKSTQVITSPNVNGVNDFRHLLGRNPVEITASNCRDAVYYSNDVVYNTAKGRVYLYERCFFNERFELVGIFGRINERVTRILKLNTYDPEQELYFNGEAVDEKLIKYITKYNTRIKVNILSNRTFNNLCNCKMTIAEDRAFVKRLMGMFISNNFGSNISNMNLLDDGVIIPEPRPEVDGVRLVDDTVARNEDGTLATLDEEEDDEEEFFNEGVEEAADEFIGGEQTLTYTTADTVQTVPININRNTEQYTQEQWGEVIQQLRTTLLHVDNETNPNPNFIGHTMTEEFARQILHQEIAQADVQLGDEEDPFDDDDPDYDLP